MNARQKTISVALSRSMAPAGRIVVYCMFQGDIINDALNFYVYDARLDTVSIVDSYKALVICVLDQRLILIK